MLSGLVRRLRPLLALATIIGLAGAAQAASGRLPSSPDIWTVRSGDTLSAIALRTHVPLERLLSLNGGVDPRRMAIGTRLRLRSSGASAPSVSPVRTGAVAPGPSAAVNHILPAQLQRQPRRLALRPAFDRAAKATSVPTDLLQAVAWQESGWQNEMVSSTHAVGIGQLMPDTVTFVNGQLLHDSLDPRRPEENIRLSARYLAWLLQHTGGDVPTAVASYYQGLRSVQTQDQIPDTRAYVRNVLALRPRFR